MKDNGGYSLPSRSDREGGGESQASYTKPDPKRGAHLRGNIKHAGFVGISYGGIFLSLIFFVFLFQFIAVKSFGLDPGSTLIRPYPNSSGLVYFDVFGYIFSLRNGFNDIQDRLLNVFTTFPSISFGGDIIAGLKSLVNIIAVVVNVSFLPLKFIVIMPLQMVTLILGFSISNGFSDFLSTMASIAIPYWN